MQSFLLFFDIGNTNTKIGLLPSGGNMLSYVLPSNERQTSDELGLALLAVVRHAGFSPEAVEGALAASVVPGMGELLARAVKRYMGITLLFTPEDVPIPLENRYTRPHEVGADRLVGAYAARRLFPQSASVISVDYGTATTFDCVEEGAYLGGLICPGVLSSVSALASGTAKLPRISLQVEGDVPLPGVSTATSLSHGFVFGFAAMTEGLFAKLGQTLKGPVSYVGTGGFASSIAAVTGCFDAVQPDLLLDGLSLLYRESISR